MYYCSNDGITWVIHTRYDYADTYKFIISEPNTTQKIDWKNEGF